MTAQASWRAALEGWRIPQEILDQAPESPWWFPPEAFAPDESHGLSVSHRRADEALPDGGSVIDVGAGGGAMSRPLRERSGRVVAVDEQKSMLDRCDADEKIEGRWPDVAPQAGTADVVVCGHVLYNVADLTDFVTALDKAASQRVVVEITEKHPLTWTGPLWKRFWDLDRPDGPSWDDAVGVIEECGFHPEVESWEGERSIVGFHNHAGWAAFIRRRLCLPREREAEVEVALADVPPPSRRRLVTMWW